MQWKKDEGTIKGLSTLIGIFESFAKI